MNYNLTLAAEGGGMLNLPWRMAGDKELNSQQMKARKVTKAESGR
jgi:hypothetical protein